MRLCRARPRRPRSLARPRGAGERAARVSARASAWCRNGFARGAGAGERAARRGRRPAETSAGDAVEGSASASSATRARYAFTEGATGSRRAGPTPAAAQRAGGLRRGAARGGGCRSASAPRAALGGGPAVRTTCTALASTDPGIRSRQRRSSPPPAPSLPPQPPACAAGWRAMEIANGCSSGWCAAGSICMPWASRVLMSAERCVHGRSPAVLVMNTCRKTSPCCSARAGIPQQPRRDAGYIFCIVPRCTRSENVCAAGCRGVKT